MKIEKLPDGGIRVSSGAPWEGIVGYCRAIRKGPMVWVAGTAPIRNGELAGGDDAGAQAQVCLEIIREALEAAGASLENVVRTRIYVTNISEWEAVGRVHGQFFGNIRPAATMVEVSALIDKRMKVEIEVDAYVG